MAYVRKVPDPHGQIARIRVRMPRDCSVRKSRFCDYIIAMRLQGIPYNKIEEFLIKQGEGERIPAATLWRNFKQTKIEIKLPYAEEVAERWGGNMDLDLARELAGQLILQRRRLDRLVRQEAEKQKTNPNYSDKRIRSEMLAFNDMLKNLNGMMKDPIEAAKEREEADILAGKPKAQLTPDSEALLVDMIVRGELRMQEEGNNGTKLP